MSVTITGNINDLTGTAITSNCYVRFWLRGCNGNQPRVGGAALIAPDNGPTYWQDFAPNGSGQISGTLYSNDVNISAGGQVGVTWYDVQVFLNGQGGSYTPYALADGTTFNLNSATPITTNPVVATPTGDSTYARLDGGNTPFTGKVSFFGGLATKITPWADVKAYGALGDGVTDDTAAIQSAMNASHNVFFPEGTYIINADSVNNSDGSSGGIIPQSNSRLILSANTILKAKANSTGSYNVIRLNLLSNISISGGTIDGNKANCTAPGGTQFGFGVNIAGSTDVYISNTVFQNCWGDGIFVRRGSDNTTRAQRVYIYGVKCDLNRRNGMSVINVVDMDVSGSTFSNTSGVSPQAGVDVEPGAVGQDVSNFTFRGNHVTGNTGRGITFSAAASSTMSGVVVNGNSITSNLAEAIAFGFAISGMQVTNNYVFNNGTSAGSDVAAIYALNIVNGLISGNYVASNKNIGISVDGATGGVTVQGNVVVSNGLYGITVDSTASNPQYVHVIGNIVRENQKHGIWVEQVTPTDLLISGNFAIGNGQATDNTWDNIFVQNSANLSITGNIVRKGTLTNKSRDGIHSVANTLAYIAYNDALNGGSTGDIIDSSSSGTVLQFNRLTSALNTTNQTITPVVAGANDLGSTGLPWGNFWLGTAATNNFKFQPAATTGARIITVADPLSPTTVGLPLTIASGTSTLTANATLAATTSQTAITTAGTGILTTDTVEWSYASAPTAGDALCILSAYPTAGNVNFVRANPTAGNQNVSAIVINWRVIR